MTIADSQIPEYELRITFLFHCAFATPPDGSRTDVLLAPGSVNGAHDMQHIASLRVPAANVGDLAGLPSKEAVTAQKKPVVTSQRTETLRTTPGGKPEIVSEHDYVFRLEGYDVWIDPLDASAARRGEFPATTSVRFATSDGADTFVIANIAAIGGRRIDPRCTSDYDFPPELWQGARVRVWGGSLRCGVPEGNLKHRRWAVGRQPVGLSDRMEYQKKVSGPVIVRYRRFDDESREFSTVQLRPDANGVIRIYVTNDPFVEDMPKGAVGVDPCKELPHFSSYGLLLEPAGVEKPLRTPELVTLTGGAGFPIAEGNSFCCPCGGEP